MLSSGCPSPATAPTQTCNPLYDDTEPEFGLVMMLYPNWGKYMGVSYEINPGPGHGIGMTMMDCLSGSLAGNMQVCTIQNENDVSGSPDTVEYGGSDSRGRRRAR